MPLIRSRPDKSRVILFCLILGSCLVQLSYIWSSPVERLTSYSVVDDAFYYLNIARHCASGQGLSFDGLHQTNGFQPLWQLLVLPLGCLSSKTIALRLLCTLGALIFQLAALMLYFYAAALFERRLALFAVALWVLNARLLLTYALSGMEFSLYALCVLIFLFQLQRLRIYPGPPSRQGYLSLGVCWGLCTLARIDGVLLGGLVLATAFPFRSVKRDARHWLQASIAALLGLFIIIGTYLIWNITTFHHFLPISGTIKLHATSRQLQSLGIGLLSPRHLKLAGAEGGYFLIKYFLRFFTGYFYYIFRLLRLSQDQAGVAGLIVFFISVVLALSATGWRALRQALGKIALPLTFVVVHFIVYALLLFPYLNYGNWYFGPLYLAFCLLTAIVLESACARIKRLVLPAICLLTLANMAVFFFFHNEPKINVMGAGECLNFIDSRLRGEKIGAWNTGYLGFFSDQNTFVNLDGLVGDDELAHYHLQGLPLTDYLQKNQIHYLCDYQESPAEINSGFYGFKPAQYTVIFRSQFFHPPFIDSRIYYLVRLKQ